VDGIVTLEDILEEIVGDIYDESDSPERDIIVRDDGDVIVDGGVLVADLNSRFGLRIPEGDYDTIAGFVFTALGRIPAPGDEIRLGLKGIFSEPEVNGDQNHTPGEAQAKGADRERALLTVQRVRGNRIASVKLRLFQLSEESTEPSELESSSKTQDVISVQDAKS
jgi:CBS domain containing-hemolysin-like protein